MGLDPPEHEIPTPHPRNLAAWQAWSLVLDCRTWTMGGPASIDWTAASHVLELYNLWNASVHRKLRICINELLAIEREARD